ncbi:MAG: hypothetical protein K6G10_09310 [Butyrivibrio sp.]|nr:hypothetical protein [Butyrivibrio sp.]
MLTALMLFFVYGVYGPEVTEAEEVEAAAAPLVSLSDYVGHYRDEDNIELAVYKENGRYTMSVGILRVTELEEGSVYPTSQGVVFDSIDGFGKPMKVFFYKYVKEIEGDDGTKTSVEGYALRIEESSFPGLESGRVYENIQKQVVY